MESHLMKNFLVAIFLALIGIAASQNCPSAVTNDTGLLSIYNDKCYHFVQTALTWSEASTSCNTLVSGGLLATIPNEATQNYISGRASALSDDGISSKNDYWLGGRLGSDGLTHTWTTGESNSYTNWDSGFPNNTIGNCLYMSVMQNGAWRTAACSNSVWMFGYICTYNLENSASHGAGASMLFLLLGIALWKLLKE